MCTLCKKGMKFQSAPVVSDIFCSRVANMGKYRPGKTIIRREIQDAPSSSQVLQAIHTDERCRSSLGRALERPKTLQSDDSMLRIEEKPIQSKFAISPGLLISASSTSEMIKSPTLGNFLKPSPSSYTPSYRRRYSDFSPLTDRP